jgi:hypothetical protein
MARGYFITLEGGEGVVRARVDGNDVGITDDEVAVVTDVGDDPAQPRCPVSEVDRVAYDAVRGRPQELDHRRPRAGVVAQPHVALPDLVEPGQQ